MSVVTNFFLVTSVGEDEAVGRLNAWLYERDDYCGQLAKLDTDGAGGNRSLEQDLWAMAANHFLDDNLVALPVALPSFGWEWPEEVVLLVNHEYDEVTRVYRAQEVDRPARWLPEPESETPS
jgi:hypothetical protein